MKKQARMPANQILVRVTTALGAGMKGEILRLNHKSEQNDLLLLARVHGWPVTTERDGKQFRVIAA
jgi:hypothetical protein